jgi:hypothetical protein
MSLYSLEGASGRCYDYILLNQRTRAAIPMGGGNFLFARPLGNGLEIICAGETESIWNVFVSTALWETAKNKHGATLAYVHLNPDRGERQREAADLIGKYRPPMNVERAADAETPACETPVA